jgi:hypothetical protein
VLEWAIEQGLSIRGRLSLEQLAALGRVFGASAPWSFDLYEPLRALTHATARLELPDLPARIHFGDALEALEQVLQRDAASGAATGALGAGLRRYDWGVDHRLSAAAFTELGFAQTSAGISALRTRHRAGWQEHADTNREFLLRACADAAPSALLVIGAGKLYDVPLKSLTQRFERVFLLDVDEASLDESAKRVLGPTLPSHVKLLTSEVTGVAGFLVAALNELFEGGACSSEAGAYDALLALLYSFRAPRPASLASPGALQLALGEAPSLSACASTMLLSQLAVPLTQLVERRFLQRFPHSRCLQQRDFQVAFGQLTHRIQHAHLQALLAAAPLVAITTDVTDQATRWTPRGVEPASGPLALIGAAQLEELLPRQQARLSASARWYWPRLSPSSRSPHGRLLEVNGCAVSTSAR